MKILSGAAIAAMLILGAGTASAATYTLRLGSVLAPSDPLQVAAEGFKKSVEERSNGEIEVQLFPSSQLGDTQDMMDQAQTGANIGTFVESSRVSVHVPQFNVMIAPYAFDNVEQLVRFTGTDLFKSWEEELTAKTGLVLLSYNWYQGPREMLTKKPIATPADLAGQRIRTIGEPLWIETVTAMGGVPTPMAFAEVYPSLQTGALDGAEVQPAAIWGAKLHEVVTDITLTDHIFLMSGLIVSDAWLKSLPEDMQTIVWEEADRWGASALKANVEGAEKIWNDIRATGVNVTTIDTAPFKEAVQPVYEKLGLTDLVSQVRAAVAE